jgi:hypothetical protein
MTIAAVSFSASRLIRGNRQVEAVRMYDVVVGASPPRDRAGITFDDQPEIGVSCGFDTACTVTREYPGSPAEGELRVGDVITGITPVPFPTITDPRARAGRRS